MGADLTRAGATCFLEKPIRLERLLEEVELVEKSQVDLTIGIIDPDRDHREQTDRALSSLGCEVHAWESIVGMLAAEGAASTLSVLLVDGALSEAEDAIRWANGHGTAAVAFEDEMLDPDQDRLMRSGASFCLSKPIDAEALVTQARFFVAPVPGRMAGA
jgi:CheY-like chemotaxis protein